MSDSVPLFEIEVPARAEFVRIVRLVVAGVGNVARFNLEEIEDLKLAAGEACYTSFHGARSPDARVRISARVVQDGVELTVAREHLPDEIPDLFPSETAEKAVGFTLLKHLVDEVSLHAGRKTTRIEMVKRREDPSPAPAPGEEAPEPDSYLSM